jgi:hypothetical protein
MVSEAGQPGRQRYDRWFLLGEKRNEQPGSLAGLTARFPWSAAKVYDLNAAGQNHGLLLATHGWAPA